MEELVVKMLVAKLMAVNKVVKVQLVIKMVKRNYRVVRSLKHDK